MFCLGAPLPVEATALYYANSRGHCSGPVTIQHSQDTTHARCQITEVVGLLYDLQYRDVGTLTRVRGQKVLDEVYVQQYVRHMYDI